jgi:hypothetical protein
MLLLKDNSKLVTQSLKNIESCTNLAGLCLVFELSMETLTVTGIEVDERKPAQLITTVNSKEGRLLPTQVSYGRLLMENPLFCVKFSLYPNLQG